MYILEQTQTLLLRPCDKPYHSQIGWQILRLYLHLMSLILDPKKLC